MPAAFVVTLALMPSSVKVTVLPDNAFPALLSVALRVIAAPDAAAVGPVYVTTGTSFVTVRVEAADAAA